MLPCTNIKQNVRLRASLVVNYRRCFPMIKTCKIENQHRFTCVINPILQFYNKQEDVENSKHLIWASFVVAIDFCDINLNLPYCKLQQKYTTVLRFIQTSLFFFVLRIYLSAAGFLFRIYLTSNVDCLFAFSILLNSLMSNTSNTSNTNQLQHLLIQTIIAQNIRFL